MVTGSSHGDIGPRSRMPLPQRARPLNSTATFRASFFVSIFGAAIVLLPLGLAFGWWTAEQSAALRDALLGLIAIAGGGTAMALRRSQRNGGR